MVGPSMLTRETCAGPHYLTNATQYIKESLTLQSGVASFPNLHQSNEDAKVGDTQITQLIWGISLNFTN